MVFFNNPVLVELAEHVGRLYTPNYERRLPYYNIRKKYRVKKFELIYGLQQLAGYLKPQP